MKPLLLQDLLSLINLKADQNVLVQGFAIDSRLVKKGDLFFALSGNKKDGHEFLNEVSAQGGVAAVVHASYRGPSFGMVLIVVPDVLLTLQTLAKNLLHKRKTKVVGITGSLGKTTTKVFASQLLSSTQAIYASPLSYNSQRTLPLSILQAPDEIEWLLLEMGMSEPGNIRSLISIAPPTISMITTVAIQHADAFSDGLKGIAREKGTIFSHSQTQLGLLHHEVPHFEEIMSCGTCQKKTFSLVSKKAHFFLEIFPESVRVYEEEQLGCEIKLSFDYRPAYHNFLSAVSLCRSLGLSWTSIEEGAPTLLLPPMRFEKLVKKGITFINDAFNANPDAMKAAFESIPIPKEGGKKIAFLSEMNALGMYSEAGHALVAEAALNRFDHLICIGERCEIMRKIWKQNKRPIDLCVTREEMIAKLKEIARPGDVVLVKGARFYALDQLIKEIS